MNHLSNIITNHMDNSTMKQLAMVVMEVGLDDGNATIESLENKNELRRGAGNQPDGRRIKIWTSHISDISFFHGKAPMEFGVHDWAMSASKFGTCLGSNGSYRFSCRVLG